MGIEDQIEHETFLGNVGYRQQETMQSGMQLMCGNSTPHWGNHLIPVVVWRASPPTNQLQSHKAFSALSISRCIFNINPTQTSNSIFRDFYIPHLCVDS